MEHRRDLKSASIVWWRFFWRYGLFFIALILLSGLLLNLLNPLPPFWSYMVLLSSGLCANIVASMIGIIYQLNRKFGKSPLILQGRKEAISYFGMFWIWLQYFWRFSVIAVAIAAILGYMLPICFRHAGLDPLKALEYSKYLGNISIPPASFLAFISLICRKEGRQALRIAVSR